MREGTAEMAGGTSVQFSPSAGGGLQAGKQLLDAEIAQGVAAFELGQVQGHGGGLW